MKRATPHATTFHSVKGKVVVVSDGANGIGAAIVERLFRNKAHVFFGDLDTDAAMDVVKRLEAEEGKGGEVTFVECNFTGYANVYNLFKTAYDKYGRIDHAFSIPDIGFDRWSWSDQDLTVDFVDYAAAVDDVSASGTAIFVRIGLVFLRSNKRRKDNRSLTLTSGVAGSEGLLEGSIPSASVQGVVGLMRSMGKTIYEQDGIRVNCICPGITESPINTPLIGMMPDEYTQTVDDCARFYVGMANNPSMNGKAIHVREGKGWELENGSSNSKK